MKAKANQQAVVQQAKQTEADCVDDIDATLESSQLAPEADAVGDPPATDTGAKNLPKGHGRNGVNAFSNATRHTDHEHVRESIAHRLLAQHDPSHRGHAIDSFAKAHRLVHHEHTHGSRQVDVPRT
ncbi:MAG: hypothetical protein MUF54_01865 [Polyangiaceae bacterium]|jgi:hypothetical protein|nr:hypothetical protein [Polyangiaceae bacterium]